MADAFSQFEILLRERVPDGVINLMMEDDDVAWGLIGAMQPETVGGAAEYDTVAADYPSQYEAKYKIKIQRGGRVAGRKFSGGTFVTSGKDSQLYMGQGADAKYLDPKLTPLASYIQIKMVLKRVIGDLAINRQQFYADLIDTPVEDIAADQTIDAVERVRAWSTNAFYSDGTGSLAQALAAVNVDETAGGQVVTLTGGSFARFNMGDLVVAASTANPRVQRLGNGANGGVGRMYVVDIDRTSLPGAIRLQSAPGVGTVAIQVNDHLMLEESYIFGGASNAVNATVQQGVESLLITTGVFPGSISPKFPTGCDVAHYNVLRSFVEGTEGGTDEPSMPLMSSLIDNIKNAKRTVPTAWIAERGVWSRWSILDQQTQAVVQVPMGAQYQAAGGVAGPALSHMEDRFNKFTSVKVRPKSILGLNPDTWKKFIPMGDRSIHWFYGRGPMAGVSSIFAPVVDGTQPTETAHAPFDAFCEFGCFDPQANFRRVGLNTVS